MHDVVAEVRAYHPPFNPPSAQVSHIRWFFGPYYWDPTYDLAVSRLDDLGGFVDCLVPDSGVGVGEGSSGGVEPGGDRGPPLDGDGGAPALVEVADGEDAVFVAGLGEGVLRRPRL